MHLNSQWQEGRNMDLALSKIKGTVVLAEIPKNKPGGILYRTANGIHPCKNDLAYVRKSQPQPHPYLWNDVNEFTPPSCKLQLYTISGISVNGKYNEFVKGFITNWAYLLPSPSKQKGNLK